MHPPDFANTFPVINHNGRQRTLLIRISVQCGCCNVCTNADNALKLSSQHNNAHFLCIKTFHIFRFWNMQRVLEKGNLVRHKQKRNPSNEKSMALCAHSPQIPCHMLLSEFSNSIFMI